MNRQTASVSRQLTEHPGDIDGMMTTVFVNLPVTAQDGDYRSRVTARRIEHAVSRVYHQDEMLRQRRLRAGSLSLYREEAALSEAASGHERYGRNACVMNR